MYYLWQQYKLILVLSLQCRKNGILSLLVSDPPELQLCRVCRSPQFWSHYRSLQPLLEITPEFITSGCTAVCSGAGTPSPSSQYKAIRRTDRDTLAGVKPN